jgi:dihydrofolate reductase
MNIILACDSNYGIGIQNKLPPWKLKDDMDRFKTLTIGDGKNIVVMGKNTYASLKRPLPNRINIVVSTSLYDKYNVDEDSKFINKSGFIMCSNFYSALEYANLIKFINHDSGTIWIIGGAHLYEYVLQETSRAILLGTNEILPIENIYVTKINKNYDCDVFLKSNTISFIENCQWTSIENKKAIDYEYSFCEFLSQKK